MKLPKLFGKKKEEKDEFDEDDSVIEEIDREGLGDDVDDELEESMNASSAPAAVNDADGDGPATEEEYHDVNDHGDVDHDADEHIADDEEHEMVGEDGAGVNQSDDMDDDFDGDFEEDDDEEDDADFRKKAIVFAAFGFAVLLLSILGGAGWWIFSGDSEPTVAEKEERPGVVSMDMPAVPGSLNASISSLNSAAFGEQPAEDSTAAAPVPADAAPEPESSSFASTAPGEETSGTTMNSLNSLNSVIGSNSAGGGMVIPAVASGAMALIPDQPSAADQSRALSKAPISALLEEKDGVGKLPKIGSNGSKPWQVYARPLDPSITEPKIALMIEGVGLSRQASLGAIKKLPAEVSIVLSPYARDLDDWVFRARLAGHEVYISMPMESEDFPLEDAGPLALDTRIQLAENESRLDTVMASAGGYVGLVTMMGSRFMNADGQLRQVIKTINDRGLMFVIGGARSRNGALPIAKELNIAYAESEMYIDAIPRIQQIRTNLDRLEAMAKERGSIMATARPYPVSIKNILDWIATIKDKGVALVPVSAVATLPSLVQ